ncbi:restriction endonuclease subunit S [Terrisporobacter hibernicus]|uniref:Restriction endonuclease subunit S n=1 Tax=Terrisporobacter hibernicus TaxID=2813371 RepID=A0AAX2ZFS3_9FIRM|nr:restriction endonuclease subunit S [Terrisporobacter hibernicus]UEL47217.1 restriction endonuclease subunit S [Terrisporobacter hibernicus]
MRVSAEFKEVKSIGRIPIDWEVKSFLEAVEILDFRGKTPLKLGMKWGGDIPALSANNVKMGYIDFNLPTHYGSLELYNNWMTKGDINKGDIILTTEAPAGNVAVIEDDRKYILSQRVIGIKTDNILINNYFLKYYFMSEFFKEYLNQFTTGSTVVGISQKSLAYLNIPIPSIKEQEKISKILSNVDMNIEKTEAAIAKYKQVKKGLMDDLLTGKVRIKGGKKFRETRFKEVKGIGKIPWDWEVKALLDISTQIKDGTHGTHKDVEKGIPLLSAKDINNGKMNIPDDCRRISRDDYSSIHKNYRLEKNDLLITIVGTIGRTAIIEDNNIEFTFQRSVGIVRIKDEDFYKYVYYYMNLEQYQNQLDKLVNASAQGGIYLGSLGGTFIAKPSFEEQQSIAIILENQDQLINKEEKYLEKLNKLKIGLMEDLLTGKVRVDVD